MGLKRAENQVKILLQETIIALCRNTLNSYGEVCVEGLLGVTLDNEEIFLVSINEMFNNPEVAKKLKKNLKRSKEAGDGSDSETEHSDGDDHGDAPKKRKKKRPRKKKKKGDSATTGSGGSGEESGSSTDQDDNDDNTETEANTTQDDHTNNHTDQMNPPHLNIAPEPSNRSSTADHDHRNTKSEEEDSNDLQKIKIKEELEDEDDDEDLVFVKEEIGDSSFNQNQYSNYSSDGQMYMPPGGMHSGQGGLMQMPGQSNVSGNQYSQDFMGDMSNMSNISQGSDSQMMGFSQGQQNMSFTGASPVAGPSSASGAKPVLMCILCGKWFKGPWNLKLHMRIHTGEKPHQCTYCKKRFSQTSHMKRHVDKVHLSKVQMDGTGTLHQGDQPPLVDIFPTGGAKVKQKPKEFGLAEKVVHLGLFPNLASSFERLAANLDSVVGQNDSNADSADMEGIGHDTSDMDTDKADADRADLGVSSLDRPSTSGLDILSQSALNMARASLGTDMNRPSHSATELDMISRIASDVGRIIPGGLDLERISRTIAEAADRVSNSPSP